MTDFVEKQKQESILIDSSEGESEEYDINNADDSQLIMSQQEASQLDAELKNLEQSLDKADLPGNNSDVCSDSESEEGPPI